MSPSTSSTWTVEPTTSSIRGSTLTRTPMALAMRISSTTPRVSVVVGTTMMRSTCSSRTMRATASGLPTRSSSPSSGRVAMTAACAWLRVKLLADPLRALWLADHEAPLDRQAARGRPAGERPAARDGEEADQPQHRDLERLQAAVEQHRLQDRHAQRVDAGQLREQRRLVERRRHEPERVAVIEPGDLEHEHDEREGGERDRGRRGAPGHEQDEQQREAGAEDVGDGQQPAVHRLALEQRRERGVGAFDEAGTQRRRRHQRATDSAQMGRAHGHDGVVLVNRQPCGELRRRHVGLEPRGLGTDQRRRSLRFSSGPRRSSESPPIRR